MLMFPMFLLAVSGSLPRLRKRKLSAGAYDTRNWMQNIDGDAELGQLAIPGTHDSGAYRIPSNLGECQDWGINQQLINGIRFLDIRISNKATSDLVAIRFVHKYILAVDRPSWEDFELRHGLTHLGSFNELVMEPILEFLANYPSETILMSIKDADTLDVNRLERDFIRNSAYKFYQHPLSPSTKLRTVRGHVVLFRRYRSSANIGIRWGNSQFRIQDNYGLERECEEVSLGVFDWTQRVCLGLDYPKKAREVRAHLEAAANNFNDHRFWVNFASAQWSGLYIGNNAEVANREVLDFFYDNARRPIGTIVPMDYPNRATGVIDSIIINNFDRNKPHSRLQSLQTDGHWGSWGKMVRCPANQFVYGYRLRSEPEQDDGDDTALNDIELRCAAKGRSGGYTTIYSSYTSWGSFSSYQYCSGSENPVVGFDMRIESDQGDDDDTAANDIDLYCKTGGFISASVETSWGDWTTVLRCPSGQAVMGISTRVEAALGDGDDTALNGVKLLCEEY